MGGNTTFTCKEGSLGALCEQCDISGELWPDRYTHSSKFECVIC